MRRGGLSQGHVNGLTAMEKWVSEGVWLASLCFHCMVVTHGVPPPAPPAEPCLSVRYVFLVVARMGWVMVRWAKRGGWLV
jgi:hypothetical protein